MTTLQPRRPYTDEELRQLYPSGLQLQQVQILLRHGERTPVSPRFQNAGLRPFWPYCTAVRHMRDAVLERGKDGNGQVFTTLEWKRRLETFGPNDVPVIATGPGGELDSVCDMGMLTDKGRLTTLELGERLRTLYVDRLGFLPKTIDSADFIYLRATPVPRALQSLQQTFTGLYPSHTRAADFPPPTILARSLSDETLLPNDSSCRRFAILAQAFGQRTADRWNSTEEMAYLTKIYGKWLPEGSPKVAVDAKPRLSGIMDTVNSTDAHGPETRLPKEFYDPKARRIIEKIGVEEWFSGYKESQEYRKLGVGGLLGDITARMVGSVEQNPADGEYELTHKSGQGHRAVKFGMSGCHDTTLAACLNSVGAFPGDQWPPFTSHIAFELFRRASTPTAVQGNNGAIKTVDAAAASSTTSWLRSFFSFRSAAGQPPAGIGRKPTEELTETEKSQLDGYYVRIRYNDEVVKIPGCKPQGNHFEGDESICTLAAFKAIVDKFTPKDWKEECKRGRNEPAFPVREEPAGY
ncbi:phosphoglycerate mutase-like protein [Cryphonectria parasitica EP155]|uniref:3-phytase n=1 Tax=Cryphonectria parasitica (strain ATCC 38755 / EP155) TaxID=660469 RepID=A0A9P4YCF4_CRYP1|nr:phosphoglycerate mutase-like protein [Cryphonectria parasitica EP155]KAF3770500.1 phosphoglycerate mutase-like protein [Cryphonectria parasitica EP155]